MKYIVCLVLLFTMTLSAREFTILYTELEHPSVQDFSARYDQRLREIWGAESDISLVSPRIVEQIKYNSPTDEIKLNDETRNYLRNRGLDSLFVVVPHVQKFSITKRNRRVVQGIAEGELDIRFSIVDLTTGQSLQTMVIEADTSLFLGNTMLRSADKATNISIMDREKITTDLMNSSIELSFEMIRLFLDNRIANNEPIIEDESVEIEEEKDTVTTDNSDLETTPAEETVVEEPTE